MAMNVAIEALDRIGDGVWEVDLTPVEVRQLGTPLQQRGLVSILAVQETKFDHIARTLTFASQHVSVLNVGQSNRAILIKTDSDQKSPAGPLNTDGYQPFIESCKSHLSKDVVQIAQQLLDTINEKRKVHLFEGANRKWTSEPNFIALTIQNRNNQLLVSVKGNAETVSTEKITAKMSRRPYCEFRLSRKDQLPDAIQAALASADWK